MALVQHRTANSLAVQDQSDVRLFSIPPVLGGVCILSLRLVQMQLRLAPVRIDEQGVEGVHTDYRPRTVLADDVALRLESVSH